MDLLSLVLTLKPKKDIPPDPKKPLPLWWGRAAHALLLNTIRQLDDVLAAKLHAPANGVRPFTVSTLIGPSAKNGLQKEQTYRLRLTSFLPEVTAVLLDAAQNGPLSPGSTVELDYISFKVEDLTNSPLSCKPSGGRGTRGEGWSGLTSYQELSAPYLLAQKSAPRRVSLQFTSPTTFKSGGKHVPIPLPGLVFGSLLDRWNAYAPIAFPPEVRRYADECLAVSRYKLSSRVVAVKSRGRRMGGVGQITYTTINYDRYWMSLIRTLAEFALFSGVGAGTTMGLGQCRQEVQKIGH